jgi:hypothetical protein
MCKGSREGGFGKWRWKEEEVLDCDGKLLLG